MPYNPYEHIPYVADSDTSFAAAESMKGSAASIREQVLELIRERGGLTCDEVEEITGLKHQTASARIKELKDRSLVRPAGKRTTRSGRMAYVMVAD